MANNYFEFKQFTVRQDRCAMKVTTDACLFGAWVAKAVSSRQTAIRSALDIGTGTGLLSLMLAQKTNASIDSVEMDEAAAKQAQENGDASPWKERIFVMPGNAKNMAYTFCKNFDIIISNPPFYENELASPDHQKNIAHHGGGLLLEELLQIIKDLLEPHGQFFLLLPYKRMKDAEMLLEKKHLAITHAVFARQSTQHDHFRIMIKGEHQGSAEKKYPTSDIAIRNEQNEYTTEFIELLKDYYLYL